MDRADFRLGLGPCGKNVVALKPWVDNGGDLRITQAHDDGTSKVFFYQKDQILSRIEIERVGA